MKHPDSHLGLGLAFPALAGGAVLLLGFAASKFIGLHEQGELWEQQAAELAGNDSVFAITDPSRQPSGDVIEMWTEPGYDGTHEYVLRFGPDGASLSDPYTPTAVVGQPSGPIVACSTITGIEAYQTRTVEHGGETYSVLLTSLGNAAVCIDNE
jgi:hypothetical protein